MHLLYAEPDSAQLINLIAGGIVAFFVVTFAVAAVKANKLVRMHGREDGSAKVFDIISIVAVILALVTGFATLFIQSYLQSAALGELRDNRTAWVESHGVTTQSSTITDLEFPKEAPDEDTKFGVAQVITDDDRIVSVHLAWEDGDFVLYGTDGQPMEVLD